MLIVYCNREDEAGGHCQAGKPVFVSLRRRTEVDAGRCNKVRLAKGSHRLLSPHVGFEVVRIDPLRCLARCRKRQLNQALSVLSLSLGLF